MAKNHIELRAINQDNIFDRLELCWGHLDNWRNLEIVQKSKKWLEKANALLSPTTFIAYKSEVPVGMIEFLPQKLLKKLGLCPCRVDIEHNEIEKRYILGKKFENYLFISCLLVSKDNQGKGVGKAILNHFVNSNTLKDFDGALVYVRERDEKWDTYIHWPAGYKEFYLKAGFAILKTLDNPVGCLLCYKEARNTSLATKCASVGEDFSRCSSKS